MASSSGLEVPSLVFLLLSGNLWAPGPGERGDAVDTAVFLCSFLTQVKNERLAVGVGANCIRPLAVGGWQLAVQSPWAVGAVSQTRPLVHPYRRGNEYGH